MQGGHFSSRKILQRSHKMTNHDSSPEGSLNYLCKLDTDA